MSRKEKVSPEAERRMQRRINVGLQVVVRGADGAGHRFEEVCAILDVSRTGASFATARDISAGDDLELMIPKLGLGRPSPDDFETLAHVVRVSEGQKDGERIVGVQFVGPRFNRVFITEGS
jgi:hypothetical protein